MAITWKRGLSDRERKMEQRVAKLEERIAELEVAVSGHDISLNSLTEPKPPAAEEEKPEVIGSPKIDTWSRRKKKLIESRSDPNFVARMMNNEPPKEGPKSA
jgi:hypothetical protein